MRALRQTEEAARVMGIYALVLDALVDELRVSGTWGLDGDSRHSSMMGVISFCRSR